MYVTSEVGDLIHLIDADSGNVEQDVVVGTRPRRFAATPDGKELWVSTELSGEVPIITARNSRSRARSGFKCRGCARPT